MKAFRALTELMRAHGSCAKGRLQSSARRHNVTPEARLAGEALDRYIASKRLDGFDGVWVVVLRELEGVPPVRTLDEARELYLSLSRRAMVLDREAFRIALGLETELGWWDFIDEEDDDAEHAPFQFGGGTREGYKELAAYVPEISFALHVHSPEWFVPFGFARRFDQFESICSELNVPLSPPPGEKSHQERAEYYWALNEELVQLRQRLKLNPEQFNA